MRRFPGVAVGILARAVLMLSAIPMLAGCLFIPTFNTTIKGTTDIGAKVGDARSNRPIRVGVATRQEIVGMFGEPPYTDKTGEWTGYGWHVKNGVWVYPFCFQAIDQIEARGIELKFDGHDVLREFRGVAGVPVGEFIGMDGRYAPPPFDEGLHLSRRDVIPQTAPVR